MQLFSAVSFAVAVSAVRAFHVVAPHDVRIHAPRPLTVLRSAVASAEEPKLSLDNKLATTIVIFDVEPAEQQELVDAITDFVSVVRRQPGFVSANIHKSLDGKKVANYAQWDSQQALENFRNNADVQKHGQKLFGFGPPDSHVYEIFASESHIGPPRIISSPLKGQAAAPVVHFAEFSMPAENQPKMIELAKHNLDLAMDLEGLLTATFHKSVDGLRVINYGQWSDANAIENLKKRPGFSSDKPYWEGVAENEHHLYQLVATYLPPK